jgi:hypothetical protein
MKLVLFSIDPLQYISTIYISRERERERERERDRVERYNYKRERLSEPEWKSG